MRHAWNSQECLSMRSMCCLVGMPKPLCTKLCACSHAFVSSSLQT